MKILIFNLNKNIKIRKICGISLLLFFPLVSCLYDISENIPDKINIDLNNTIIEIEETKNNENFDFNIKKSDIIVSTVFSFLNNKQNYAYGDIIELTCGNLLLICSKGEKIEDFEHNSLIYSISENKGLTWSTPQAIKLSLMENYINVTFPNLLNLGGNHLILFFAVKYSSERIDILYKESLDGGATWEKEKIVFSPAKGYQIFHNSRVSYDGRDIILPLSIPSNHDGHLRNIEDISVFYYKSSDLGKTWEKSQLLTANIGLLEPGIVKVSDQEYLMNIRTNHGKILFARSKDNLKTWEFQPSSIKSPSSPQRIIKMKNSENLLMVWNFTDENYSIHGGNRKPLSLALSNDKGYTWKHLVDIEDETSLSDFSYPGLYETEKYIFLFYNERDTSGRFSIKLARIEK